MTHTSVGSLPMHIVCFFWWSKLVPWLSPSNSQAVPVYAAYQLAKKQTNKQNLSRALVKSFLVAITWCLHRTTGTTRGGALNEVPQVTTNRTFRHVCRCRTHFNYPWDCKVDRDPTNQWEQLRPLEEGADKSIILNQHNTLAARKNTVGLFLLTQSWIILFQSYQELLNNKIPRDFPLIPQCIFTDMQSTFFPFSYTWR